MIKTSTYDKATGKIQGIVAIQDAHFDPDIHLSELHDPLTKYVDVSDMSIHDRVDSGITISATSVVQGTAVTISNIPIPSHLYMEPFGSILVDDGVLEIDTSDTLGQIFVFFDEVSYLPVDFKFEVTAP